MNRQEFEFVLQDRIAKIQAIDAQYNLRENAYISFSGGLDSCVLSRLIDIALPNNKIPRLFINTGLEYNLMLEFVRNKMKQDSRIIELRSGVHIKRMLEKDGYPFKSKEYAQKYYEYKFLGYRSPSYIRFAECGRSFSAPKCLKYQFEESFTKKYSHLCCWNLKKIPAKHWAQENNKTIVLTGMQGEEGGQRANISCVSFNKKGDLQKFHPLLPVSNGWEWAFIMYEEIEICKLYYPPYSFKRTGCKGCPFNKEIKTDLETMEKLLPAERKQCEYLWGPVYDEYRRIGYRLDKEGGQNNGKV